MDQQRQDTNNGNNQQQNIHFYMHHVCTCQGLYQNYYPPLGYRTPLITYTTPSQTLARSYLPHYQYTQYNAGNQYGLPAMIHLPTCNATTYSSSITPAQQATSEMNFGLPLRREHADQNQKDGNENERLQNEPPPGYEIGHVTPPANDLILTNNCGDSPLSIENFIKFLERGCITAEQIAYRNRNRPCFRNIQNLCIRTKSEISKPCTTLSNIHSQGIPWATKDFIYAFIRLINCWHILRGYWEIRDGSVLGKVEKELTSEFRNSYIKWEESTIELATHLTRIYYNLDTSLNSTTNMNLVNNNLIPPQVNLNKTTTTSECSMKTKSTINNNNKINKNIRGILRLANDSNDSNFKLYDTDDTASTIYIKPGSYQVTKKSDGNEIIETNNNNNNNIPRVIEFLETAQNVTKALEAVNDKYWAKLRTRATKDEAPENEVNSETMYNVQDWLSNNSFTDYPEPPTSCTSLLAQFSDVYGITAPKEHEVPVKPAITLLQRDTNNNNNNNQKTTCDIKISSSDSIEISSRIYRRKIATYEAKSGGLTINTKRILENLLDELRSTEFAEIISKFVECPNLERIKKDIEIDYYKFVNEVVRDLRQLINYISLHLQKFNCTKETLKYFSLKFETALKVYFPNCDFSHIIGKDGEKVGKIKIKNSVFDGEQSD